MKCMYKTAAITAALLFQLPAHAEAPVSELGGGAVTLSGNNGAIVPSGSVEDRVALLERTLNARLRIQADLQQQVDALQQEVDELRGQLEQQGYQMQQSEERQRQLYQELDKVNSAQQQVASVPTAASSAAPAPVAAGNYSSNQDENQAYDAAVNMVLKEKNYDKAIPAFQGFIKQYPESSYVPNAHYWLGQLLFNKSDRAGAKGQFQTLVSKYPKSPKRADALLKLGMIAQLEGKKGDAKSYYEQVTKGYQNSSAAQLAQQALSKL